MPLQSEDGRWNKYGGKMNWDETAICSGNEQFGGRGNPKQGDDYGAAPNIDHSQVWVWVCACACVNVWVSFLRSDGVCGEIGIQHLQVIYQASHLTQSPFRLSKRSEDGVLGAKIYF
eukprot:1139325-Pelagomonas_calceolata.AAC.3